MKQQTAAKSRQRGGPNDVLRLRGYLEYVLRDARTGRVVQKGKGHNVVTFVGRGFALKQMVAGQMNSTQPIYWLGLGTSAGATNSSQTNLAGYFSMKGSNSATTGVTATTDAAATYTLAVSWSTNETHASSSAINEFALFNSSTTTGGATMFNRLTTGTTINFASTNTLAVTMTITN